MSGLEGDGDGTRLFVEAGRAYRVVAPEGVRRPSIRWPRASSLSDPRRRADYVAIGRLPAASVDEVAIVVEKILAMESAERGLELDGPTVLVVDDNDAGGHFEDNAPALATGILAARQPRTISLRVLGREPARAAIRESFDTGASLVSYLGHGGLHLCADENLFDVDDVSSLAPQSRQPLVLTLNCLNGYFHFPYFDALAEKLVKAEERGASRPSRRAASASTRRPTVSTSSCCGSSS